PSAEGHRLDGIELPEAAERDVDYRIRVALEHHDRAEAEKLCAQLPAGRVARIARQAIAMYDHDIPALLRSIEESLEAYPDDTRLLLQKQSCLAELFHTNERIEL